MSKTTTRIFVVPDMHFPFHDRRVWETMLAARREAKPDLTVIIGDAVDCYAISSHPKSPDRKANFKDEIDEGNAELDRLRSRNVLFTAGNHENRYDRLIRDKAPELYGVAPSMQALLRIEKRGWEWVPYMRYKKVGRVAFTHEIGRCGVNAARQSLLDFGGNIVFGHSHRGGVAYQGAIADGKHFAMNVGWGGDVNAIDYQHRARAERDWQHGFGLVHLDASGYAWANFVPIVGGRCSVDGAMVSGRKRAA